MSLSATNDQGNLAVLFVDDDEKLLRSLERTLNGYFQIDTAVSGDEALARLREDDRYAVIVTDQRMPRMNGDELIEKIRESAPDKACLLMTGNPNDQAVRRCVAEGLSLGLLPKPSWPEEIARAVAMVASSGRDCD